MTTLEYELRTAFKTGKVTLGSKSTIKNIKLGKAKVVVIAKNVDPNVKSDIMYYTRLAKIPVIEFNGTSLELGMLLGKPFPVQALAVLDVGESRIMELVGE